MAYVDQTKKAKIVAAAKPILKKYGVKATFGVDNHSTLVCKISEGEVDLFADLMEDRFDPEALLRVRKSFELDVNVYHVDSTFTGKSLKFMSELMGALNTDNFDKSDLQTDYFCVGHYVSVRIGAYNKPYKVL